MRDLKKSWSIGKKMEQIKFSSYCDNSIKLIYLQIKLRFEWKSNILVARHLEKDQKRKKERKKYRNIERKKDRER